MNRRAGVAILARAPIPADAGEVAVNSGADRLGNDESYLSALRHDMLRFARLQLRDEHLAEDVVQEALAAAVTGKRQFAGRSALKTWVFAILRNKIVDAIRVRNRSVNVSALADEEAELDEAFEALFKPNAHWHPAARPRDWGDPEAALHQEQFWTVFDACLNRLPPNTARVFMMREFLELDTDQVCAELRISIGNCHVILHRARNGLRRCLEQSWFAGEKSTYKQHFVRRFRRLTQMDQRVTWSGATTFRVSRCHWPLRCSICVICEICGLN